MISRRSFSSAVLASGSVLLPRSLWAAEPSNDRWRRFKLTTRLDVRADGPAQAWIPLASFTDATWVKPEGDTWTASPNAKASQVTSNGATLLHVQWDDGPRQVEVVSTFATRDRKFPPAAGQAGSLTPDERGFYLQGSAAAPTTGIVKDTADTITAGKAGDIDKARAIYEWVVVNTFRSAPVRGCGDGDIVRMLRSGVLGGKCADINPLFVALARASGIPARDLYGIRVAPSRLGYKSLGPATPVVTGAQHCRAEVYLDGSGWTAMDPADVRKVMLEEKSGGLGLDAPQVAAARSRLFGAWEGNWIPFNTANDVALPGFKASTVKFLMYPQVEAAGSLLDCYDPAKLRYDITSEEIAI